MGKRTWLVAGVALLSLTLIGCRSGPRDPSGLSGKVNVAGSTALLPLVKLAADEFQDEHLDVYINVSGGGSFTGMKLVAEGSVHIGISDVDLPADLQGKDLVDFKLCIAPFVIITHKDVAVNNLTQEQAIAIFTGKITNWKDVGGQDLPVAIIHRAASSGSRATFKAVVLGGREFTDKATIQDSNGSVRTAIEGAPGAIGYIDAAYLNASVKALQYNGVAYTPEAVTAGRYGIWAYEHLYTRGQPTGAARAFVDYLLSAEFQYRNVAKLGFVPLAK